MASGAARQTKIDILRVIAIFFVMLIHSSADSRHDLIFFFKVFIANGAVPVFFILSGYLGARKIDSPECSARDYFFAKFHGLIIPYAFWNIVLLGLVLIFKSLGIGDLFRGGGSYFDVEPSISSITSALLGINRFPIVYQFWFLRDLILASFAAFFIIRYLPRIPFLPWLLFFVPLPIASSLGYFLLGYEIKRLKFDDLDQLFQGVNIFLCVWIIAGIATISGKFSIPYPLVQLGSAAFLIFIANLISHIPHAAKLGALGSATFFVYAVHEPSQTVITKCLEKVGISVEANITWFFVIPFFVFGISSVVFHCLARFLPRFLAMITGGRAITH